ncbi:unnamed protein product [Symbiodinium sp. CCMP2592]|nr:unnamed protein product [Symbiodinium sp. CCMP2592]
MSDFQLLHLPCDAHKGATCVKACLGAVESEVSGLINSSLALGELGVLQRLRDLLTALLFNNLEIYQTEPPHDQSLTDYRRAVYDRFMPLQGDKCILNQKRRKILETMLNGDLRQAELQHYCPLGAMCCANDTQQTMSNMALYVSWALLPCQQATISRKNWIGQTDAMNWTGVLESHHGLYSRLLLMYFGTPKVVNPSRGQAATEAAPVSDDEDGMQDWKQALMDELSSAPAPADPQVVPEVHADGAGPEAAPEVDFAQAQASRDNDDLWKEMKQMRRQSAQAYAASRPYNKLYIMSETLGPLHVFMSQILKKSGGQWESKQAAKQARGEPRTFLLLEAARQQEVQQAMTDLLDILPTTPLGAHLETFTCVHRALRFAMTASGMCSLHGLIRFARQNLPYQAFHLVAEDVSDEKLSECAQRLLDTPRCLFDEFWNGFSRRYPSKSALLSAECRGLLQCIAAIAAVDVCSIESSHSSTREFAQLRSRGWTSSLEEVASRWVLLQRKRHNKGTSSAANRQNKKKPQPDSAEKKRRTGTVSAWNAFMHFHGRGLPPDAGRHSARLSAIFRSLTDEERQKYVAAAEGGSAAVRMGFPAFATAKTSKEKRQEKRHKSSQRGVSAGHSLAAPMLLPGQQVPGPAGGAIVAVPPAHLDVVGGQVTQHLRQTFPDLYQEFLAGLKKPEDELDLNEQELDSLCKFRATVDFLDVPVAKTWERDGHSQLRQNLSAHPVSSLVRGLVWNPPTEKAVEAGGLCPVCLGLDGLVGFSCT